MDRKLEIISEGRNHTAGNLGSLDRLAEYELTVAATGMKIPGKVFLAESVKASGMEVSLTSLPPGAGMPFFHTHRKNEEMYIILRGEGEFTVDGAVIPVREGSVVRIAPGGLRSWKNSGKEPLIAICVQAVAGTLEKFGGGDGVVAS